MISCTKKLLKFNEKHAVTHDKGKNVFNNSSVLLPQGCLTSLCCHKILFRWNQIVSVIQSDLFPSTAGNKLLYLVLWICFPVLQTVILNLQFCRLFIQYCENKVLIPFCQTFCWSILRNLQLAKWCQLNEFQLATKTHIELVWKKEKN
jgi:hypothetical protein